MIINRWFYDWTIDKTLVNSGAIVDMTRRAALTCNRQPDNTKQLLELKPAGTRCSHEITDAYEDHALSGKATEDQRPAFSRLLKDAVRRRFDMVAVWAVDRLGRSLDDLLEEHGKP